MTYDSFMYHISFVMLICSLYCHVIYDMYAMYARYPLHYMNEMKCYVSNVISYYIKLCDG